MKYHHIETVQCKLQIHDKSLHKSLQRQLVQFYDIGLFQVLNTVFNKYAAFEIEISKIELSLPSIPLHLFKTTYLSLIETELTNYFDAYCKDNQKIAKNKTVQTSKKDTLSILVFYLQRGYYPSITANFFDIWEQVFKEQPNVLITRLIAVKSQQLIARLVVQLPISKLWKLIQLRCPSISLLKKYYAFLKQSSINNHVVDRDFWPLALWILLDTTQEMTSTQFIQKHLYHYIQKVTISSQYLAERFSQLKDKKLTNLVAPVFLNLEQYISLKKLDTSKILTHPLENLNEQELLRTSSFLKQIFNSITFKEQEDFLYHQPFVDIQKILLNKTSFFDRFYDLTVQMFQSDIHQNKFKEFLFRYAYGYFLFSSPNTFKLANFISNFKIYIRKSIRLGYHDKQEYLSKSKHSFRALIHSEKEQISTISKGFTTTNLGLHFLQYSCFPLDALTLTFSVLDTIFTSLFQSKNNIQWRQIYTTYRQKGNRLHTPALVNYFSQKTNRIEFLLQLDTWYPLQKNEITYIKKGLQTKQKQQPNFATQLATTFQEENIYKIIAYIEPEQQPTILHFIKKSTNLVILQSLTDKLTDFKKNIYAFVLSYILLEKGYSFRKKNFVEHQIKRIAQYFNITYQELLLLFSETLDPNSSLGKTKELYLIILALKKVHKSNLNDSYKTDLNPNTHLLTQDNTSTDWSRLFVYYLTHNGFPPNSSIDSIFHLISQIPITITSKEGLKHFLKSQKNITYFLTSKIAFKQHISLDSIVRMIFTHKKHLDINKRESLIQPTSKKEDIIHWTSVFCYYLENRKLPQWSTFISIEQLLKNSNNDAETQKRIIYFLKQQNNTSFVWKSIESVSTFAFFRKKLLQYLIPSTTQQKALLAIANYFSPITSNDRQNFIKHFGIIADGSVFWKVLFSSRQLFFSNSSNQLQVFGARLQYGYGMLLSAFNIACFELIQDTAILKKITLTIDDKTYFQVADDASKRILNKLFSAPLTLSKSEIQQLKEQLQSTSENIFNTLQNLLSEKNISPSKFSELYTHWLTLFAPNNKSELVSIFKELHVLSHYSNKYTFEDSKLLSLFLWKATYHFSSKKLHLYYEFIFLELARYRKRMFQILVAECHSIATEKRDIMPQLYQGLSVLLINQRDNSQKFKNDFLVANEKDIPVISKTKQLQEGVVVSNAGIILLYKFMPLLFERLTLWDTNAKEFFNIESQNKAVLLLHYLSTGTTDFENEHDLLIQKLLCGLPPEKVIQKEQLLKHEMQLSDDLIIAAIQQWKKLGTLSIEGFRSTFLNRQGVLKIVEDLYQVNIEPTGVDILLDYLPWTISNVRLPWLEKVMHVSWREKSVF